MIVSSITLHHVAKAAGVHYSTVSLALRDDPRIAVATRENVIRVAKRLGYAAHPAARALVERRRAAPLRGPVIAWIENHPAKVAQGLAAYRKAVQDGAKRQAKALGYDWRVFRIGDAGLGAEDLDDHLQEAGVECVIVGQFVPGHAELQLDWERYCLVRVDSQHLATPLHCVSSDRIQNVRQAFREVSSLGHRRIGLCVSRLQEDCTRQRHAMGFLMEQESLGPTFRIPPLIYPYGTSQQELADLASTWIRKHGPEVILHDCEGGWPVMNQAAARPMAVSLCQVRSRAGQHRVDPMAPVVGEKAMETVAMLLRTGERGIPRFAHDTYVEGRWRDE